MILNYQVIVERYPKPIEVVGSSIPSCEIFSLLDGIRRRTLIGLHIPKWDNKEEVIGFCLKYTQFSTIAFSHS